MYNKKLDMDGFYIFHITYGGIPCSPNAVVKLTELFPVLRLLS